VCCFRSAAVEGKHGGRGRVLVQADPRRFVARMPPHQFAPFTCRQGEIVKRGHVSASSDPDRTGARDMAILKLDVRFWPSTTL